MNEEQRMTWRLRIDLDKAPATATRLASENPVITTMDEEDAKALLRHLRFRLMDCDSMRDARVNRYERIDRAISTWQQLDKNDSQRERMEDNTGRHFAIPFNVPLLASHLDDMTSYFAEALAPIQDPFSTSLGLDTVVQLAQRLNEDARARDYYSEVVLATRSLLKYNIGGISVEWDSGGADSLTNLNGTTTSGNMWEAVDPYNVLWDPTIQDPRYVATRAEWAARIRLTNRVEMAKKATAGIWANLADRLRAYTRTVQNPEMSEFPELSLWRNPSGAVPTRDGQDSRTVGSKSAGRNVNWSEYGLGHTNINATDAERPHELITMYCWLVPSQFNIYNEDQLNEIRNNGYDPEVALELWRFELVDGATIVSARPAIPPREYLETRVAQIPIYMSHLTRDQLGEAQRSMMELMKGFQRFTSAMYSIHVEGMRKNVWGLKGYDPNMFDISSLENGQVAGWLASKIPGRDVRSGLMDLNNTSGTSEALQAAQTAIGMKDQFFPSQALPSQVAGMDRAVTSQVASVMQGAQRSMRMMLRLIDSGLMLPTRMCAVRNLNRYDKSAMPTELTDEQVAKVLGSGIESIESERIVEGLWRLMIAIIQSEEAQQQYDSAGLLKYISNLMHLSVNLGSFVRQPQPQTPVESVEGAPPPPPNI